MFVGSVPRPVVSQILEVVPFEKWTAAFVCCSGSFRVDRTIKQRFPALRVVSNDVSLYSVALGRLVTGEPMALTFKDRLAFIEDRLAGADFEMRVAGLMVAHELARYAGKNVYAGRHFAHYVEGIEAYLAKALAKVRKFTSETKLDGFFAGDFRQHAGRAAREGAGVVAFPPTYKGGYERLFRFIDQNTEWQRPQYEIWDPATLDDWTGALHLEGVPYCVFADRRLGGPMAGVAPVTQYSADARRLVFTYANSDRSSVRGTAHRSQPFLYRPVDPAALTRDTKVQLVPSDGARLNFLKDVYLAKGIAHTTGQLNVLVYLDGMLAGAFIYTREKFGGEGGLYLLSDFSISRQRRLAKLVALLATCRVPVAAFERKSIVRVTNLATTVFTDRPVSMKYRGIFEISSRKPGFIQYQSNVREQSPDELYRFWWDRWGRPASDEDSARRSAKPARGRAQRPVHDEGAVRSAG